MSMSDPVGNMLAAINNGLMANKAAITVPGSKLKGGVLEVLKKEGFIRDWKDSKDDSGLPTLNIELKYFEGAPVIKNIKRVSKPGRRVYSKIKDLPKVSNGLGIAVLSTSQGVMSDYDARVNNLGGEVICNVF